MAFKLGLGPKVGIEELNDTIYEWEYERKILVKKMESLEKQIFSNIDKLADAEGFKTNILLQEIAKHNLDMEIAKADFYYMSEYINTCNQAKAILESQKRRLGIGKKLKSSQLKSLHVNFDEITQKRKNQTKELERMGYQIGQVFDHFTATPGGVEDLHDLKRLAESMQNAKAAGKPDAENDAKEHIYKKLNGMFASHSE